MRKSKFNYELTTQFIHPYTKEKLYYDNEMSLCDTKGHLLFRRVNNSYDFVINLSADRIHYDEQYDNRNNLHLESLSQITELWSKEPCQDILFDSLGTLNGKRILLLGNGMSLKELIFLLNGAELIYTDISWHAIAAIKKVIEENNIFKNMMHKIEFHSVDALNLPFDENQFDVIYGYAFVHHLENTEAFLKEVHRCLKPSGICRFMDDGYSPIWQGAKNTILKPLQVYSHKHKGISPYDRLCRKASFD